MNNDVLRMENITKIYSNGFIANDKVNLFVKQGEIHALVGENGAGKTTLMKILFGMEDYQEGKIIINGKEVDIKDPLEAIDLGVGMVHQEFMQVSSLTVAENVTLGIEPGSGFIYDKQKAVKMTQEISDKYKLKVNANERISDLSVGLRQKVEILKALVRDCKLLILDEPTAVLTPQETNELFHQLKTLKETGISIIFISHKLDEVMELCDRVTVLRSGRSVGSDKIENLNAIKISHMMVGRDIILSIDKEPSVPNEIVLSVDHLHFENNDGIKVVDDVSFIVRKGEILGMAGVEGNGQLEIVELVAGIRPVSQGDISINGKSIKKLNIKKIRELGLAYISEDRMRYGCAEDLPVRENIMADRIGDRKYRKFGYFLDDKEINSEVDQLIDEYEIMCDDPSQPVRMLSGGNIQKVIVAREFSSGGNLIVANQPTRGIDVGTTEMVRKTLIRKTREDDVATLLVSSDLNEILGISDRLLVIHKGKIVAHFKNVNEVGEETLGEYMLGIKKMEHAEMDMGA